MKVLSALTALLFLSVGSLAQASTEFASEADRVNYFTIESIETRPADLDPQLIEKLNMMQSTIRPLPTNPTINPTLPTNPQQPRSTLRLPTAPRILSKHRFL